MVQGDEKSRGNAVGVVVMFVFLDEGVYDDRRDVGVDVCPRDFGEPGAELLADGDGIVVAAEELADLFSGEIEELWHIDGW